MHHLASSYYTDSPSDQRLGLYYNERIPPFDEPCQDSQADSACSVYPPGLDTALFEQSQLPPKK
jgi:hypothetical protein